MFFIAKFSKKVLPILIVMVLLIILIFVAGIVFPEIETKSVNAGVDENDVKTAIDFLQEYQWDVNETPLEVCQIIIPAEFDLVYKTYNQLQQKQNFDLEKYKNKKVQRYTFEIKNYPTNEENVRANVLMLENQVIGGDVCSLKLDGFMHGFDMEKTGTIKQTFYVRS